MKKKPKYSYDPECEELARYFLQGYVGGKEVFTDDIKDLSQHIQDAVENWPGWARVGKSVKSEDLKS